MKYVRWIRYGMESWSNFSDCDVHCCLSLKMYKRKESTESKSFLFRPESDFFKYLFEDFTHVGLNPEPVKALIRITIKGMRTRNTGVKDSCCEGTFNHFWTQHQGRKISKNFYSLVGQTGCSLFTYLDRVGIRVLRSRVVSTTENNKEFSLGTANPWFLLLYSTLLRLPPSDSNLSEDAGIGHRTTATWAVGHSKYSAKTHSVIQGRLDITS